MYKKLVLLSLFVLNMTTFQYVLAHGDGGGGGGGSSYNFDASDRAAERNAEKKVAEKKKEQDDWAEFMQAVNEPKNENEAEKEQDHGHHDGASDK